MKYIGIDVGADKFFAVYYSDKKDFIRKIEFNEYEEINEILSGTDCVIAIDAPSGTRNSKEVRRKSEEELGIGGYFATPYKKGEAKPWMQSGFKIWKYLQSQGFKRAKYAQNKISKLGKRALIEVHPTIIFKQLYNPEIINPVLWISRQEPPNKRKSEGRRKRKKLLIKKYPRFENKINGFGIDHIDCLIGAYTAEKVSKGRAKAFGDPAEGQIWFPSLKKEA